MSDKIYDLSQPVVAGTPMWPRIAPDVQYRDTAFQGIYGTPNNHPGWPLAFRWPPSFSGGWGRGYAGHLHPATHMDAPVYCWEDGISIADVPVENCWGEGVVVDMRYLKKWDRITAADFEKATPRIKAGDFVVVNTGWQKWWDVTHYEYYHYYPGLVPSAAEWLIKKKVKAIAGTWATVDHSLAFAPLKTTMPWLYNDYVRETKKDPTEEFPAFEPCLPMLLKSGITCIQNAGGEIDQVTGKHCTFFALPCSLIDADASPVRLVATVQS